MMPRLWPALPWPTTSLQYVWQSDYISSSWNTARVKDPLVDHFVQQIVAHQGDEKALLPLGQALDRLLLLELLHAADVVYGRRSAGPLGQVFPCLPIRPAFATGL